MSQHQLLQCADCAKDCTSLQTLFFVQRPNYFMKSYQLAPNIVVGVCHACFLKTKLQQQVSTMTLANITS